MRLKFEKTREAIFRPLPAIISVAVVTLFLLLIKLRSLIPFGESEQARQIGSADLAQIKLDILFGPFKAFQLFIIKFTEDDRYIRLAGVVAALVSAYFLFLILKKWHTTRVSVLTSLLYVTSTLFLQTGRSAYTDTMYLCVIPVLLTVCLWFLSKHNDTKLPFASALVAIILYIPGSILFLIGGMFAFRKYLSRNIGKVSLKLSLISVSTFLIIVAPLFYGLFRHPEHIAEWLGFNQHQVYSLADLGHRFVSIFDQLFLNGLNDPAKWVTGSPILDIFSIAMLLLGIYAYRVGYYPAREKLIFTLTLVSFLIIWLGNFISIILILPLIYILIANGIAYMLQSWFTVFPKNPFARSVGVVVMVAVVALTAYFHLHRYFVAYPNSYSSNSSQNSAL